MDPTRFDALARALTAPTSRRVIGRFLAGLGITALAGSGVSQIENAGAKKKRRKKKKKKGSSPTPTPVCEDLGKTCSGTCCGGLECATVTKEACELAGDVCCRAEADECAGHCDCCGDLNCSERLGDSCQDCLFQGDRCLAEEGDDQCCDLDHSCENTNADGFTCCADPGAACNADRDCCGGSAFCEGGGAEDPTCCRKIRGECLVDDDCCNTFRCGDGSVCCLGSQETCTPNEGECCAPFTCSERFSACRTCAGVGETCDPNKPDNGDSDCCRLSSTCETVTKTACPPGIVCCQGEGESCLLGDCDCCGDLVCDFSSGPGQCVDP